MEEVDKENDCRARKDLQANQAKTSKRSKILSQPVESEIKKQSIRKWGNYQSDEVVSQNLENESPRKPRRRSKYATKRENDFKKILMQLANAESFEVVKKLSEKNDLLAKMLSNLVDLREFQLVVAILAKVCDSDLEKHKAMILSQSCNPLFMHGLPVKLARAFSVVKAPHAIQLAEDLGNLLSTLIKMPVFAADFMCSVEMCYNLLVAINQEKPGCITSEILLQYENATKDMKALKTLTAKQSNRGLGRKFDVKPPEDFRELSLYPTYFDVTCKDPPFIRPNIVKGPYKDVEHYLDIQFRLLKEDFTRPLRESMQDLMHGNETSNKRDSSITIMKGVKFSTHVREFDKKTKRLINEGSLLCLNFSQARHPKIDWKTSKRFMRGSLLCFSRDSFRTMLFAVVSCRDQKYISKNRILVNFPEVPEENIYDPRAEYTMVEYDVFFEPYFQVMKVFQSLNKENFPFAKYFVLMQKEDEPPRYVQNQREDIFIPRMIAQRESPVRIWAKGVSGAKQHEFVVLDESTWPTSIQLGLDNSQYQALKAALTREVTVIQGPPGTGKTFMALKIAEILVRNKRELNRHGPIEVISLTNHALDQFLVGTLSFTTSVVRVGGQSQCKELDKYNLRQLKVRHSSDYYEMQSFLTELYLDIISVENDIRYLEAARREPGLCISLSGTKVPRILEESIEKLIAPPSGTCDLYYVSFKDIVNSIKLWRTTDIEELEKPLGDDKPNEYPESEKKYMKWEVKLRKKRVEERYVYFLSVVQSLEEDLRKVFNNMPKTGQKLSKMWKKGCELDYPCLLNAYCYMVDTLLGLPETRKTLMKKAAENRAVLEEQRQIEKLETLRGMDIIGLTTNGAARLHSFLDMLACETVIVEEAAEVMEPHIIASISSKVKHLILIGDHKQLRPKISNYDLETKYKFNISLFERLVDNRESCITLQVQHRMAPEMAKLIVPTIYKTLQNHESVHHLPGIKSLTKRLFFVTHANPENRDRGSTSKTNPHEAKYLVALCEHLLRQRYKPQQITILTMYKGQMFLMKELVNKTSNCKLKEVRVTVVDDFQGEESDVILLSLVRSNPESRIGFVASENRVCVALSRAKHGCVMMGNMDQLSAQNAVWKAVRQSLEEQGALVQALPFRCEAHPDNTYIAENPDDFKTCAPHGGCTTFCPEKLPCGHDCNRMCHVEATHDEIKCEEPCDRFCDAGAHRCQQKCYVNCGPNCKVKVTKELPCLHQISMACGADVESYPCPQIVTKIMAFCSHEVDVACHSNVCPLMCEALMPCGHKCAKKCHADSDPEHLEYKCRKPCEKTGKNCRMNHACVNLCFEECAPCKTKVPVALSCGHTCKLECCFDPEEFVCTATCSKELECGHICHRKCDESCIPCMQPVPKEIECGHTAQVECGRSVERSDCTRKCEKLLPCGHKCRANCAEECTINCREVVGMSVGDCGHNIKQLCFEKAQDRKVDVLRCTARCGQTLICGHKCGGSCKGCCQGRFHEPCQKPCERELICGHKCNKDCSEPCQSCNQKRTITCDHSTFELSCTKKSTVCQVSSKSKCSHGKKFVCGAFKGVVPCKRPCPKMLPCQHPCSGYCGAACPKLCWLCDHELLLRSFPKNAKIPKQPRFIVLPECQHTIEAEGLLAWFKMQSSNVEIKTCPLCKIPISARIDAYKNMIWEHFEDLNRIKELCQTNAHKIVPVLRNKISGLLRSNVKLRSVVKYIQHLKYTFEEESGKKNFNYIYFVLDLPTYTFKIQLLQLLVNILEGKSELQLGAVAQEVKFLVSRLSTTSFIWKQQIKDYEALLRRLCGNLGKEMEINLSEPISLLKYHWLKCLKCHYLQFGHRDATSNCKKCSKPLDVKFIEF